MGKIIFSQVIPLHLARVPLRGKIACRVKCPVCGGRDYAKPENVPALICRGCNTPAVKGFAIFLWWGGCTRCISCDTDGQPFPSYDHADVARREISRQIEAGRFDPEAWRSPRTNVCLVSEPLRQFCTFS